jgi:hypothetical protein
VEAFERFINLNVIAIGLLQVLALEMPQQVALSFSGWFRTVPQHGYPSEQIVRIAIQNQRDSILFRSKPCLLLHKFLTDRLRAFQSIDQPSLDP